MNKRIRNNRANQKKIVGYLKSQYEYGPYYVIYSDGSIRERIKRPPKTPPFKDDWNKFTTAEKIKGFIISFFTTIIGLTPFWGTALITAIQHPEFLNDIMNISRKGILFISFFFLVFYFISTMSLFGGGVYYDYCKKRRKS
jgi:hypothetical protein